MFMYALVGLASLFVAAALNNALLPHVGMVTLTIVVAPVLEEALKRIAGPSWISGLVFGVLECVLYARSPIGVLAKLVSTVPMHSAASASKSVWGAIALHALFNTLAHVSPVAAMLLGCGIIVGALLRRLP